MKPARPDDQDPGFGETWPCAVGLLATTLSLMTHRAQLGPAESADGSAAGRLIARKVLSNLFVLQHHPALPPGLRQLAARLQGCWQDLAQVPAAPSADDGRPALH